MEQPEDQKKFADQSAKVSTPPPIKPPFEKSNFNAYSQQSVVSNPNDRGLTALSFIYAVGRVEPRFPSLAIEKEYAQIIGRESTGGLTDRQTLREALSMRHNRYLVRQMCWVLIVGGLETYILQPRDPADFDLLVGALRPEPSLKDIDVVVGLQGPLAPPEMCGGLMVPVVLFDQVYSFDRDSLILSIPRRERTSERKFGPAAEELLDRLLQATDNAGASDEHRAFNYLALRYHAIYEKAVEMFEHDFSLSAIENRPSPLSSIRRIVEVIFSFRHRKTDFTEKFYVRVDVTDEFPFLVTKLSPYYDR